MKLTSKQKIFCDEYLVDLNATRAYKSAYKNIKKDETAAVNGNRLLRNAKVKYYIDKRIKDREKRTEITQDKVLNELAAIAFSNGSKYAKVVEKTAYNEDGQPILDPETGEPMKYKTVDLVLTDELTNEEKKAISSIKRGKNGIEVSTCDKVKALELLGKHLGMFKDKLEIDANINSTAKLDSILEQLGDEDNE
ncbi:terminase small subunit [Hathewaya histolytica]|uniref:Terminase small subunit n=1 Tax=Hathewaya histolytica TaxID=1498 RepID=A0A4U9RDT2_HATHI|nr:terminase small subunit [Hathewaya histolytica]VTQ89809.1 terminase small subunit [Hathewaya histolytica]